MMYGYRSPDKGRFKRVQRSALYLTMRDGVELAVDVWLPGPLPAGAKLPTLLHQTRYWRAPELRWPFSKMSDGLIGPEGKMVRELLMNGFAFVNVDCRGSGASFGTRMHPWSPPEVEDGREVVEWILQQPWTTGMIGTIGISYTGTTAEFATHLNHPAIKAAMPLFSLYDVYDDIALPGGIPHDGFVLEWGRANASLDRNRIPLKNPMVHLLVKGVAEVGVGATKAVSRKQAHAKHQAAIASHAGNLGVHETSAGIEFRDQAPKNRIIERMDDFSPHHHQSKADASGVALLSLSGWRDGAYPHSSIRRFLNSKSPVNRLILGPWDHGGKNHITPGKEHPMQGEIASEAIKFFDHHLKGYATGMDQEPAVQYFTMQAERWQGAAAWPPPASKPSAFFLQPGGLLSPAPPAAGASVTLVHNPAQGTGHYTRWRGLRMTLGTGKLYPDRKKRDQLLACFDSPPLSQAMEVTGHPEVRLYIRTQEPDGSFFVYLEDITPGGEVWHVTEGALRALHRKLGTDAPPYRDVVPYHSYCSLDAAPMPAGEVVELAFDLLPVSYLFRKGHRVRIAVATGDCDNFRQISMAGAKFELLLGESRVILPVG